MENNNQNLFERFNQWLSESVSIKLVSIGFLVLLLLIPASWIQSIMHERQHRNDEVRHEISSKWSNAQTITGPVLAVPFLKEVEVIKEGKTELRMVKQTAFFTPTDMQAEGELLPQTLHRGIFDAVVYESQLAISARFDSLSGERLGIRTEDFIWAEAHLLLGIEDLRGVMNNPTITLNNQALISEPTDGASTVGAQGIKARLNLSARPGMLDFAISLNLKGSQTLSFIPLGKNAKVQLQGAWESPSYVGEFLPAERSLELGIFKAQWQVLHYNRSLPLQWVESKDLSRAAAVGVKLLLPVDQYQKSIRTAKYGILIILLTFLSLFMSELVLKVRIHPFQYILIGSALSIYYLLLLAVSEHAGYDWAYVLASMATTGLIALYSLSFMPKKKNAVTLGGFLILFYGFIYVIIQQEDYALLMGSLGLFAIIATLMYLSRGINWYK